ncbi:MarR family winged helix-turn-helix transcriptional regulator [Ammoniphilus sp. CFH 90114]|uniref:MarR family winged helix-turn-helix transcriptional regulator n=1 Tax=Ammoniphilus sp. CFH 90114 TaxID=2493665 RepID=UPI0013E9290E|nr:MarR family transcriptional regulator [Ammoniphilus sp. CFH 90114]
MNNDKKLDLQDIQQMFTALTKKGAYEWNQLNQTDLYITHVLILQLLEEKGRQRPTILAEELQITTGGITGLTNKLVKEGLIRRSMSEQDRRVIFLEITDQGKEVLTKVIKQKENLTEKLFGSLTDTDVKELKRILQLLLKSS